MEALCSVDSREGRLKLRVADVSESIVIKVVTGGNDEAAVDAICHLAHLGGRHEET